MPPITKPFNAGWVCAVGFTDAHPSQPDAQAYGRVPAADSAPHHVGRARQNMRHVRAKQCVAVLVNRNFKESL